MDRSQLLSAGLPIISAALSVAFFCSWLAQKRQGYILDWALSYAFGALGAGIGLVRISLAEAAWFSFAANALLVAMAYFAVRGSLRRLGRGAEAVLLPIYALTLLAGLWFGFVQPSIFARGSIASLGAAIMFAYGARIMLRADSADTVDRLTAIAFVLTAFALVGRPLATYLFEGALQHEAEVTGSWWGVSFRILAMLSWVSMAVLFLQRITTDLLRDLRIQTHTDPLTGVLNRRGFFARASAAAPKGAFAVLLCDIDEFKRVNDGFGHKAGDTVVRDLAGVLTAASAPAPHSVGRLGGDEFVLLLAGADLTRTRDMAERLRAAFAATAHHGVPPTHPVTVSIGGAIAFPGEPLDAALARADAALYRAKQNGRNRVEIDILPLATHTPPPRLRIRG
ncbi:MAG: hypothetical protein ABS76_27280 [Pelagibacterium sp. SCN 64-44]|nr:MAG: hypothetical protein ABS76_27280 [Pelagibacterium sp. SCN 64-44]